MKPQATVAEEQHRLKRPAALADAEIAHLETVVRSFLNSRSRDAPEYLGLSYWLTRVAGIDEQFDLVPAQQQRLDKLQTMLVGAAPSKPMVCPHKCCACNR